MFVWMMAVNMMCVYGCNMTVI